MTCECADCSYFKFGDWVEFKLNTDVMGIVIGSDIHGLVYDVQLAGSGLVRKFYGVTLRGLEESDEVPGGGETASSDNVIKVDFTRGGNLRDMDPKGAA